MNSILPPGEFFGKRVHHCKSAGISFSEYVFSPAARIPLHIHESAYFYLVVQGSCIETYGNKSRIGLPSTLLYSPAGAQHSDVWQATNGRVFNIEFAPTWLESALPQPRTLYHPCDFQTGYLVTLAVRLYKEFKAQDTLSPLAMQGLTLEILAEASRVERKASEHKSPRWLRQVKDLLHDRFTESLSLDEIARAVDRHPTHVAREFRQHYRCTVGDYLRELRMEQARHTLSTSDTPLVEIAFAAGYSDQSHFATAFKRHTGLTPAAFRKIFRTR